eukprot:Nitzschia sp. Nitz4//scaffold598_size2540//1133//2488//NITZ4_009290-RA/size2540-processed-gene-0.0-mRNA-1//-1//CDS//3329555076//8052//frame0
MIKLKKYEELSPTEQLSRLQSSVHMSSRRMGRQPVIMDEIQRSRGSMATRWSSADDFASGSGQGIFSKSSPKLVPSSKIELITNYPAFPYSLVEAVFDACIDDASGRFKSNSVPTKKHMSTTDPVMATEPLTESRIDVGSFAGSPCFMLRVHTRGQSSSGKGSLQLYSRTTGNLECIFADDGVLDRSRTAAVVASMIRLGSRNVKRIGIVGTGMQARAQLPFLRTFTECREAMVWGRNHTSCELFVKDMSIEGWAVEEAETPDELLKECEVVITATNAHEALLGKSEESDNAVRLLCCIGANAVGKQELDPQLVDSAAVLVSDCVERSLVVGEFQHWAKSGDKSRVKSLTEVLSAGESAPVGLTVLDLVGDALMNTVVSQVVHEKLTEKDISFRSSFREDSTPLAWIPGHAGQSSVIIDSAAADLTTNVSTKLSKIASGSEVSEEDVIVDA